MNEKEFKKILSLVVAKAKKGNTFQIDIEQWPKSLKVNGFDEAYAIYKKLLNFFNGLSVRLDLRDLENDSSYWCNCIRSFSVGIDENNAIHFIIETENDLDKQLFLYAVEKFVIGE
jgi:hypothetical protein